MTFSCARVQLRHSLGAPATCRGQAAFARLGQHPCVSPAACGPRSADATPDPQPSTSRATGSTRPAAAIPERHMRIDVEEHDHSFIVNADIPGVQKDSIKVSVDRYVQGSWLP